MTAQPPALRLIRAVWLWCWLCVGLGLGASCWAQTAAASSPQPVPALTARVMDQTGTLSAQEQQALEAKLAAFEQRKGSQIVLLLLPSTQPEDIASYANRVANTWKIGRKGVGDGLLLIVAKDDRKMRFEVAKTLEGAIPDLAAYRIINETMKPAFRAGDFAGGLDKALDQAIGLIDGEPLPEPQETSSSEEGEHGLFVMGMLVFFIVPILAKFAKALLGAAGGSLLTAAILGGIAWWLLAWWGFALLVAVISFVIALLGFGGGGGYISTGSGSSYGGSFGGGGFSSGGGGDFGGGGASGDW